MFRFPRDRRGAPGFRAGRQGAPLVRASPGAGWGSRVRGAPRAGRGRRRHGDDAAAEVQAAEGHDVGVSLHAEEDGINQNEGDDEALDRC